MQEHSLPQRAFAETLGTALFNEFVLDYAPRPFATGIGEEARMLGLAP